MDKKRKYNSSGESLSELLVAALIISLAMIMLFSGVKIGTDIMNNNREKYDQYNAEINRYEEEQAVYAKAYAAAVNPDVPVTPPASYTFKKGMLTAPI